jgi:hypothetical protein
LEPVEEAIRSVFLPALLQAAEAECQRKLTAVSVRKDGLGLPDPTQSAPGCFAASEACTGLLVGSLREGTELDANMHGRHAGLKRRLAQKKQEAADERIFAQLLAAANTSTKRRMLRAKETGTWLTTMPNRLNATELSADEFQDSLWLRLRLAPLGLPDRCDGCSHRFSLGHAMTCKKGGLVLLCHNNVVAEWHHLCAQALSLSGRQRGGSTSRRRATSGTSWQHRRLRILEARSDGYLRRSRHRYRRSVPPRPGFSQDPSQAREGEEGQVRRRLPGSAPYLHSSRVFGGRIERH